MDQPPQPNASSIAAAIEKISSEITRAHADSPQLLLLGIANGGIALAERIAQHLRRAGQKPILGTLDISFHRDDIGANPIPKEFAPTVIPHDVNDLPVILIDDVLHSGRTVKAALDELFDHGRPQSVELAVLVDRGGRKLPIAADYSGLTLNVGDDEKVVVRLSSDRRDDAIQVLSKSALKSAS